MNKKNYFNKLFIGFSILLILVLNDESIKALTNEGVNVKNSFGSLIDFTKVINWIFILVCISIIGIIGFSIKWTIKNKTERKWRRRIKYFFLSFALIIIFALNMIINIFRSPIGLYLVSYKTNQEVMDKSTDDSRSLVEQIEDEGIVLLENKNNALPLNLSNDKEKKINVFGQASVQLTYGGAGSGSGDESKNVTLQEGLENAGFILNDKVTDFYKESLPSKDGVNIFALSGGNYNLQEPSSKDFSSELISSAKEFSDVALIVLSRNGGEGGDLPMDMTKYTGESDKHYLELSSAEREMIDMVKSMDFEKVVVIINSSNAMELAFLEEEEIDAAIWIGGPGSTGANSVAKVLSGEVNPSGRLVDTYAYDLTSSPAYYNAGEFKFTNSEKTNEKGKTTYNYFVDYAEGIYVGYRFYETRFVNNETGEMDEDAYNKTVQYPFGYGLSYTNFKQEIVDYKTDNEKIEVTVKVTNIGDESGKDVVQLYYTAPYYESGIEKSHVVLSAFDKTEILEPGTSETLKLEFNVEDMASYDYKNEKAYVLDKGKYQIKLMNNAHDVIESREYNVNNTIVYNKDNKRSSDEVAATNQFDFANDNLNFVSRSNWEGTLPKERAKDREASEEVLEKIYDRSVEDNPDDEDIVFANHGLELKDMIGLDYNDPKWDKLLEQISIEEMANLIGFGSYNTRAIKSIGKPITNDIDGPAGLNGLLTGVKGVQYCSEVVLASTWNIDLAETMGEYMGSEALANGVTGLYAPAVNIHRTPFSGRNFEYYSEDSLISGKMGAAVVKGGSSKGVYYYLKHFALNDQETNRIELTVWSNEQAIREIYLKAFEIPVKEANANAIMTSVNRIGAKWTGASYELLTTVLRNEWGFEGMVVTDNCMYDYADPDQAIRAGNDLMLMPLDFNGTLPTEKSTETNTGRQAMRQATKNILYTVANSAGMELSANIAFPTWIIIYALVDALLLSLVCFGFYRAAHKKYIKKEKKSKISVKSV